MTTYSRRDSATARLRKAGVNSRDYDAFITVSGDQHDTPVQYHLDETLLAKHLADLAGQGVELPNVKRMAEKLGATEEAKPTKDDASVTRLERSLKTQAAQKVVKEAVKKSGDKRSIASVIRQLLLEGKTNQEVWDVAQPLFGLSAKQRSYPAWFRAEQRKAGNLPKKS